MDKLDFEKIWQSILNEIRSTTSSPSFKTWFQRSSLVDVQNETAFICLSSNFAISYIKKNFEEIIIDLLSQYLGVPIKKIEFKEIKKESSNSRASLDPSQPRLIDLEPKDQAPVIEQVKVASSATLNDRYTFENFIVGNKNRLAYAAALAVANSPGLSYNPLYIYGGVGLGKTHLMQAVGNEILKKDPEKKVIYVSCETFLNEMVNAIQTSSVEKFKRKYRNIDVFLVDDIQFIAGKESTQEEFFHTYNALHQTNKQIIITSDKVPQDIPKLENRLASRFAAGMIADIQPPDLEMRQAILLRKSLEQHKQINPEILRQIAELVDSNIRELEGALITVVSYGEINKTSLTPEVVKEALKHFQQTNKKNNKPSISLIKDIICQFYKIDEEEIGSSRRNKELVKPRQIFMYLLKTELNMSFPNIGREVGGRDHTTVIYGVEKINKELKKNTDFQDEVKEIKSRFYTA